MKSHENIFEWRDQEKIKKIIQHFENGIYDTVIGEYNITHEENISYL